MKLIGTALAIASLCAVGLGAQSTTTETSRSKTRVKVDGGTSVTVSGCLERNPEGGYMITDAAGGMKYALVGGEHLDKRVGHRVEVKGKATDLGDGKVKIESKTTGTSGTSHEHSELKGGDVHALGVKSMKTLSKSCS